MTPEQFRAAHPDLFYLSIDDPRSLENYLRRLGVLAEGERVDSLTVAGEGNMNRTLRIEIADKNNRQRSLIVKQSHPWVERYPEIAAPWDRVLGEAKFYGLTSASKKIASRMPRLVEVDPEARVLVLEDRGDRGDYASLYRGEQLTSLEAETIADWLSDLHATTFPAQFHEGLADRGMRELNHEHLFRFPLDPSNGLDLDTITLGLADEARRLANDKTYVVRVAALGATYLQGPQSGDVLLHGDFFPGSWLRTDSGPMVIDPEFAFFGPAEFDFGVLLGHLYLASQESSVHEMVLNTYRPSASFDWHLTLGFCAAEIMRRLIGVAQLPLTLGLKEKQRLLALSHQLITSSTPLQTPDLQGVALIERKNSASQHDKVG